MTLRVHWPQRIQIEIPSEKLRAQLTRELQQAFHPDGARTVTVTQRFKGYSDCPQQKIVLGVEVSLPATFRSHIVKIGEKAEVAADFRGWEQCMLRRAIASRRGPAGAGARHDPEGSLFCHPRDAGACGWPKRLWGAV